MKTLELHLQRCLVPLPLNLPNQILIPSHLQLVGLIPHHSLVWDGQLKEAEHPTLLRPPHDVWVKVRWCDLLRERVYSLSLSLWLWWRVR